MARGRGDGLPQRAPHLANEAGWGSPERSIGGSDGVPTVSERDGGDRADWREILGGPRPRTTEGSSREPCGAKGIPSLASPEASGVPGPSHSAEGRA